MHPDELLAAIRREGAAMASQLSDDLAAEVPSCPGWTLETLTNHCGRVHRWATACVRARAADQPVAFPAKPPVADHQWFEEGVAELAAALEEEGPESPAWNFMMVTPAEARFWFRRQAHETAVHRWDAELAGRGDAEPIEVELAIDGIDEMLDVILVRRLQFVEAEPGPLGGMVHVHATDSPHGEWLVRTEGRELMVGHGHEKGDAAVRGTASDLLLWMWGRAPTDRLEVFGDDALVARWHEVLSPP